jgi:hypothetical protein
MCMGGYCMPCTSPLYMYMIVLTIDMHTTASKGGVPTAAALHLTTHGLFVASLLLLCVCVCVCVCV